jgi:NAD(P)-dependent dehydrogenase (short-subunit alcohol dehydrogenase family)
MIRRPAKTSHTTFNRLFSLEGRVAVVTGACGQLGRQFAEALCGAGAFVVLTDLDHRIVRKMAGELSTRYPGQVSALVMDVTRRRSIQTATAQIVRTEGKIDILLNNAGIGIFTPFESRTEEEVRRAIDINLKGTLWCSQLFSEPMRARKSGCIINIGSIYGVISADPRIYAKSGRNSSEVYAATKAGVIHLTRYLAVYLAPHGIRVNAISPGGVFNHQDPEFVTNYCAKAPLGRMATPTDLEGALIYLASDASSYVTGHNLIVDGGITLW